jgi:hypothetical protein
MPDGLFYPRSHKVWTREGIKTISEWSFFAILLTLQSMTKNKTRFRHYLRQDGMSKLRAFGLSRYLSPVLMGFHKTRVIDSGFDCILRSEWLNQYSAWKTGLSDELLKKMTEYESLLQDSQDRLFE